MSFAVDKSAEWEADMADDGALRSAEARLKAIDKEAKNLVDALCASGASAPAFVMARLNELETERSNVQAMVLFEQSMREQVMDAGSIQTFYERYNGVDPHEALVRDELMRYFVRDVLVYDDKVVIRGKWKDGDDYTIGVDNHFWEEYPEEAAAGTITVSGRLFRASRLPDSSSQARLSTGLNSRHEQRGDRFENLCKGSTICLTLPMSKEQGILPSTSFAL